MEVIELETIENFQRKCGEMFLTLSGDIKFLCTLCDCVYHCFQDYADHMVDHYENNTLEEYSLPVKIHHEKEELYEEFVREEDLDSMLSEERTLEENELPIVNSNQKGTPEAVLKEYDANDIQSSDTAFNINRNKTDNEVKNKKLTCQLRRKSQTDSLEKRRFKCTECDFSCKDKSNLNGHIKRHSNRKPYQCSECSKEFYTRTELKSHFRRHTGERPFLCTDCGLTFFTSGILSAHIKRHKNIRDKECSVCHKRFFDSATLVVHTRTHTGERPFKCKLCSASFKRGNALVSHMQTHENKREFQCEFCPARFNQKCNLNTHRKRKHFLAKSAKTERKSKIVILDGELNH